MKILIVILAITLNLFALNAQGERVQYNTSEKNSFTDIPDEVKSSIDKFFTEMVNGNIKKAYEGILKDSPILNNKDDLRNLIEQTTKSIDIYGSLKDYEAVSVEKASPSYIRFRYLGLHTDFPMRWLFTFYNSPGSGWILTNIKFDDLSEFFFDEE